MIQEKQSTTKFRGGVALTAFAFVALRVSPPAQAGGAHAPALHCRSAVATVLHRSSAFAAPGATETWAVVRVSLQRSGLPGAAPRVIWHAGPGAVRVLRAVAATAFTPASQSCSAVATSFDYALLATPHGVVTKILPAVAPVLARAARAKQLSQVP